MSNNDFGDGYYKPTDGPWADKTQPSGNEQRPNTPSSPSQQPTDHNQGLPPTHQEVGGWGRNNSNTPAASTPSGSTANPSSAPKSPSTSPEQQTPKDNTSSQQNARQESQGNQNQPQPTAAGERSLKEAASAPVRDENLSEAENKAREAGAQATVAAINSTGVGAAALKVPGAKQIAERVGAEGTSKAIKAAKTAIAAYISFILVILLAVFGGGTVVITTTVIAAAQGFPVPGDPEDIALENPDTSLWEQAGLEEEPTAADLMPGQWAEVLYEAQEDAAEPRFAVPWTVLAGLARTQSDFGRASPYDDIDRDGERNPIYGPPPGATGSSGISSSNYTYTGPVFFVTDELTEKTAAATQAGVPNNIRSVNLSSFDDLPSVLEVKNSDYEVVTIAVSAPSSKTSEQLSKTISAAMTKIGEGRTVYWANGYNPEKPGEQSAYNKALRDAAAKYENLTIIDWASVAATIKPPLKTSELKGAGASRFTRLLVDAIKTTTATGAWVSPLKPGTFTLTAVYNQYGEMWATKHHTGLDMAAPTGTEIFAASDGTVQFAGDDGPYGNKIEILHAGGLETWYAHTSAMFVTAGQKVSAGQLIGKVGATGNVSGPHLHLEVRIGGQTQNPLAHIPAIKPGPSTSAVSSLFQGTDSFFGVSAVSSYAHTGIQEGLNATEETSDCAVPTPQQPIGGGKNQAVGPFLLLPGPAQEMREDGLDPQNPCESALWVAQQLNEVGVDIISDYREWEDDDEVAKQLWTDLINQSDLFADPTNGDTDCTVTTNVNADNAAGVFRETIECYAGLSRVLQVATSVEKTEQGVDFSVLDGSQAAEQLATEALTVASLGPDKLNPDKCKPGNAYAGVFPLTKQEAQTLGVDRCDAAQVIDAVSKTVVANASSDVADRPTGQGPYQPMVADWQTFSAATGTPVIQAIKTGPYRLWEPRANCVSTMSKAWQNVVSKHGQEIDPLTTGPLTPPAAEQINNWLSQENLGRKSECAGAADTDYYSQLSVVAEGLAEASRGDGQEEQTAESSVTVDSANTKRYILLASYAQSIAGALDKAEVFSIGKDAGVERLRVRKVQMPKNFTPNLGYDDTTTTTYPTAQAAVQYAVGYGGIRPDWETASEDVLTGVALADSGVFLAGGGDAAAVIAAAKTQLGVPYSWGGGGPGGPGYGIEHGAGIKGFDCSGLMEFAFAKAGYPGIGDTSNAQKVAGQAVVGGLEKAIPGDLLFWGAPTTYHVALYLGNGQMIHAPRTGDVVKIAPVMPDVTYIRRVIPEGAGSGWTVSSSISSDKLAEKLPESGKEYAPLFVTFGTKYRIDPALLAGVAMTESGFRQDVITCKVGSSAGAQGMMQFMPATAQGMGVDPCSPASAIEGAARYLRQLLNQFGTPQKALAAYNYGPGNVANGNPWPEETRSYVQKVPTFCQQFGGCRAV